MKMKMRYPQKSLAACVLPWREDFSLDCEVFERHVTGAIDSGATSIYLMGTAGEGYALSDAQFREVVRRFAQLTVKPGLDPQIGVISLSLPHVIERFRFAYDQGIRMFQISLPCWGALDEQERLLFFETVCGAFPDCRFLHYNLPRAKVVVGGAEYRRIADSVPNLVATKNSTSDYLRVADLMKNAGDLQHFLVESSFAFGCLLGECSLLCSFSGLFPRTTERFFEAGRARDLETLFKLHTLLNNVNVFANCRREMIDGAYDKVHVWLKDPDFPIRMLPPYIGLTPEEAADCRRIFDEKYADLD